MQQLTDTVWTLDYPLSLFGVQLGTRSVVIRLPSGRLVLIGPVRFDDETARQIDELGQVDTIVAPNLHHHLFFPAACERWPEARQLVPEGTKQKRDVPETATEMAPMGSIEDAVHWHRVEGASALGEHLFVDSQSGVLVITDLAFHFQNHDHWLTRWFLRCYGVYGKFTPSRLIRFLIKDAEAAGESLQRVLEYDWDAVVVAHGEVIEQGGREVFEEAFERYLA